MLMVAALAGCGGVEMKKGERAHNRREIPPGPGILTGEKGEFVIFRRETPKGEANEVPSE